MSRPLRISLRAAAIAIAALPGAAAAQGGEAAEYETVVHGRPRLATEDATAIAETIDVSDETRRFLTVGEALDAAAGVQVRTLGGKGAYGATSIRGSTSGQVPVYLDGVLLNAGGFATVDLGALGLDVVDRIEIYRGATPPSLPSAGIGGAVVLRTRAFERPFTEVAASFGSFGTARLTALRAERIGPVRALALASASGSEGDFEYLNRNGTVYDTSDDAIVPRRNNAHTAYEAFLKLDFSGGGARWTLADDFGVKHQGVPGTESVAAVRSRLRTTRNAASASAEARPASRLRLRADASYLVLTDAFDDPLGEVGVGAGSNGSRSDSVGGGLALGWGVHERHLLSTRLDGRYERFGISASGADAPPPPARRSTAGLVLSDEWSPVPSCRVVPSLRLEQRRSAFGGGTLPGRAGALEAKTVDELHAQPAIGVIVDWGLGLESRLNAGRYVRAPDLAELFGDRGAAVGNPELEAETAWNADAGLAWQVEELRALDLLRLEGAVFASRARELIAYVQNSQSTVRPENVSRAEILGAEAAARASFLRAVTLFANYTYLRAVNRSPAPYLYGRRLPGRPAHALYARAELERRFGALDWNAAADLDYAGATWLDQANLKDAGPGAALLGLELGVEHARTRLSLTLEIDNLLDTTTVVGSDGRTRPLADFDGFPLPGRSFVATLRWRN